MQTRLPFKFLEVGNNRTSTELVPSHNIGISSNGGGIAYTYRKHGGKGYSIGVPRIWIKNYRNTVSLFEIADNDYDS